jgi:hypothetical protein
MSKEMFQALCDVLGTSKPLVDYWYQTKPARIDQMNDAAELLHTSDYPISRLAESLESWKANDWRGKQGQMPTVEQFAEHAIVEWNLSQQAQQTLIDLDVRRPRWQGKFDKLRSWRVELAGEADAARWAKMADLFRDADRLDSEIYCRERATVDTTKIDYTLWELR